MSAKLTPEHLRRRALVYVRQSTLAQVFEHTESQRRQYELAEMASRLGFTAVETIDEDLGRSGSGLVQRPGFERLVAAVCSGTVGAVLCIEASRLARNGRDWHHLIDLCALVGTIVIDPDGMYDPQLTNDRLLLGLKGTMSEYELSLLRQRGLAARDSKAKRGELRFALPPGFCWNELGHIEIDSDERVADSVRLVFKKFAELGSARQAVLWMQTNGLCMPVLSQGSRGSHLEWRPAVYHNLMAIIRNPQYAGAYVFGRTEVRTRVVDGRALKTHGHKKPREQWSVLIRDHHPGYITWEEFERNQRMISENAHMQKRTTRKSGRGGHALLTGLLRCGRCGRMLRVVYGMKSGHAHRYWCRGATDQNVARPCSGIGGVRIDRAVGAELLQAIAPQAIEAALQAAERAVHKSADARKSLMRELEEAQYNAGLASRRYEAVDPDKRLVARELETRWEAALARIRSIEERIASLDQVAVAPQVDRNKLLALATDLPALWNSATADARTKQRIVQILLQEVIVEVDEERNEVVLTLHWTGGRHSKVHVERVRVGRYPEDRAPSAEEAVRKLGGQWPDRQVAVTMNLMRCKKEGPGCWTEVRVRELRERLGIAAFDPAAHREKTVSMDEAAHRLGISVGSVRRPIREGILAATQIMPSAPWQIPVTALESEGVKGGVEAVIKRRSSKSNHLQNANESRLPDL